MSPTEHVEVAVRVRPFSNHELERCSACIVQCEGDSVVVQAEQSNDSTQFPVSFTVDRTFWSADARTPRYAGQDTLYEDFGAGALRAGLEGYNGCVIAFGQTGSGKTHTMLGESTDLGIIPRTMEAVFEQKTIIEAFAAPGVCPTAGELRVWVSCAELFNEQIRDLLQPNRPSQDLRISDHPDLGVCLPGIIWAPCSTVAEARKLIAFASRKRAVSATNLNGVSSRSHMLLTVKIQRFVGAPPASGTRDDRMVSTARLNFVDLAGSEVSRFSRSSAVEQGSAAINESLSALGIVIKALAEHQATGSSRKARAPFRASKLTFLLKDAFSGNAKTFVIATVSPASKCLNETMSTLHFATTVRSIKTAAVRNVGLSTDRLIQSLQAEMRRLRSKRADSADGGVSPGDDPIRQELMQRDYMLQQLKKPYEQQLEEALELEAARDRALQELGISPVLDGEASRVDDDTPYMLNMNSDPSLAGCVVYYLQPGFTTSIGARPENDIVLCGLGVPDFLCMIENLDQQIVAIKAAPALQEAAVPEAKIPLWVNGALLKVDERRLLQHLDYVIFGRAHALRLVIPAELRLSDNHESVMLDRQDLHEPNMLRLLGRDESQAWGELRLYFEDLWQRLGEERGTDFFAWLAEASHLVDEASEITAELRQDDRLKFEVELVWDIHREARDIIVIRLMQFPMVGDNASVMCYWTLETFKERVEMMRDCYHVFQRQGEWPGRGDALEDPWMDPTAMELGLRMQIVAEDEIRRLDEQTVPEEAQRVDGRQQSDEETDGSNAMRYANATGAGAKARGRGGARNAGRSTRVLPGRSARGNDRATPARPRPTGAAASRGPRRSPLSEAPVESRPPWGGGSAVPSGSARLRSPSTERQETAVDSVQPQAAARAPSAERRAAVERGGAHERGGVRRMPSQSPPAEEAILSSAATEVYEVTTPQPEKLAQTPVPNVEPDGELPGGPAKDALIAQLRAQLAERENREQLYKGNIQSLRVKLNILEQQHGSLLNLGSIASEHERQVAHPMLPQNFSNMMTSATTLSGSYVAGSSAATMSLAQTQAQAPPGGSATYARSLPTGGRPALSGRLEAHSLSSSAQISATAAAAVPTGSSASAAPQRLTSSRSTVPASTVQNGSPLTTVSRSMTLPIATSSPQPTRASSVASSFAAQASFVSVPSATIATAVPQAPAQAPAVHRVQTAPPLVIESLQTAPQLVIEPRTA